MPLSDQSRHIELLDDIEGMLDELKEFTPQERELFEDYIGGFKSKEDTQDCLLVLLTKEYEQSALADHLSNLPEE